MKQKLVNKLTLFILAVIVIVLGIIIVKAIQKTATNIRENIQTRQEEKRLDWILEQINELYLLNEDYTNKRNELEQQQTELHESAESNREQIATLRNEYYKSNDNEDIMGLICTSVPTSPMCNNYRMLDDLKRIAEERNVSYKLLLWIMYHESKLGTARSPSKECAGSNNWAWLKARKYDDGSVSEWFDKQPNRIEGCWLYNFETVNDFFESLANTISLWYRKCLDRPEPVSCISAVYVGKYSQPRVDSVRKFSDFNS